MVVLRDIQKEAAQCGGVSLFESAQSLVLIHGQHDYYGPTSARNYLRFTCKRGIHQGAEPVLGVL